MEKERVENPKKKQKGIFFGAEETAGIEEGKEKKQKKKNCLRRGPGRERERERKPEKKKEK